MAADLRERNKARTRVAIVRAALQLFAEGGYDQTTIPMIAASAGVSPRTVSTYFPVKADIPVGPINGVLGRLERCLAQRGSRETTLDAVQRWLMTEVEVGDETGDNLVRRAMARNPALQVRERERIMTAERSIAASIARELDLAPDAMAPRLIAVAAIAMVFELWGHKHLPDPGNQIVHIADEVEQIPTAIAMLRAAQSKIPAESRTRSGTRRRA